MDDKSSLDELDKKISAKIDQRVEDTSVKNKQMSGFAFISELMAAIIVGGGLGYFIDQWFKTGWIFFIVFMLLGVAAGVLNIYKQAVKNSEK